MKKYLTISLLISVLGIGVFGFTSVTHSNNHHAGCIASMVQNAPCPDSVAEMAVHHIQAYITFFSVVPSLPFTLLFMLLLAFFLSRETFISKLETYKKTHPSSQVQRRRFQSIPLLRDITHWLSLFENSPSVA